jgi:hypothetical protein
VWDEYKAAHRGEPGLAEHPARWALVEIENLYDSGITFEPIYRVLFGVGVAAVLRALSKLPGFSARPVGGRVELTQLVSDSDAAKSRLGILGGGEWWLTESDATGIVTNTLEPLLDEFLATQNPELVSIDYIHGTEELFRIIGETKDLVVGILLPPVKKSGLFQTVAKSGPLPRKSFSMGEALEKRFYLECRKITY